MNNCVALDLAAFFANPTAELESISIEEVLMYVGYTGEQNKYWNLDIDHELTLKYDFYTVSLSLTTANRLPLKGNEHIGVIDMIDNSDFNFALTEDSHISDVVITMADGISSISDILELPKDCNYEEVFISFDTTADDKRLFYIANDELRDDVLIAFKEGLNRNSIHRDNNLSKQLTDRIVEKMRELAKVEAS